MMERHAQVERTVLGTMLAENYLIADSGVKVDSVVYLQQKTTNKVAIPNI